MTTKFIGTKELRQNLFSISKEVGAGKAKYVVMNKNRPLFTMRPFVEEEVALMPSKKLQKWIKESREEYKRGEDYGPFETVAEVMKFLRS